MGIVYRILNTVDDKSYIGYTSRTDVSYRIREHFHSSKYEKNDTPLYNAIRKYGKEAFIHEVLFESKDEQSALDKEKEYIKMYGDYNLHEGGNIPPNQKGRHWKLSEETKEKMRKPKPPRTEEHCKNLAESLKGNIPWNKGLETDSTKYSTLYMREYNQGKRRRK